MCRLDLDIYRYFGRVPTSNRYAVLLRENRNFRTYMNLSCPVYVSLIHLIVDRMHDDKHRNSLN